ncbi:hypothetical protein MCOR03_008881 [Pyricularia oryzae]|nr:hypothetical protein MCOR01_002095 [Pyricularia oryzae]KAI6288158.1 hypothetical protein MCOR26_000166 [Pyricularia oryzae]KAI6322954.1 hypothetical protein MCOR34_002035 [Pyricularia oryzae]KAI6345553.1 hypothetical protein MCOR28_003473 [Pyricularia oryzae]KAI6379689.1 hypothetical protein MCOR32_004394 [Pyricularia oryzae]
MPRGTKYNPRAAMLLPEGLLPMLALFLSTSPIMVAAATIAAAGRVLPVPEGQYPLHMTIPASAWQPRETAGWTADAAVEKGADVPMSGFSPRPTDGPRFGSMDIFRRQAATLNPNECGFLPNGVAFSCPGDGASCKHDGTHLGCCQKDGSCKFRAKTCIDYKASVGGACNGITDPATRCCSESSNAFCFTLQFSTSTEPGKIITLLDCQASPGTGILYNSPPPRTTKASPTSKKSPASTQPANSTTGYGSGPTNPSDGDRPGDPEQQQQPAPTSSPNTSKGVIAGGVVGGVAFLGLIGATVLFLIRRRKAPKTRASNSGGDTSMPGATYPPTSPYQTHLSASYGSPADTNTPFSVEQQQQQQQTQKQGWFPHSTHSSVHGTPQSTTPMQQAHSPYRPLVAPAELYHPHVIHELPGDSPPPRQGTTTT